MWINAAVYCALLTAVLASITIGSLEPKPDKYKDAEGCYISELDVLIPFNETLNRRCQEIFCDIKAITYTSCVLISVVDPCVIIEDKNKPYPDCCPRTECPDLINATELTPTE